MRLNLEEMTYIVTLVSALVVGTWKLSQQKAEILKLLDNDMSDINRNLNEIKYNLGLHTTEYANRERLTDFKLQTIEDSIQTSFKRCQSQIRDIQRFLERDTGFNIRDNANDT